jgi:hypothetical protein
MSLFVIQVQSGSLNSNCNNSRSFDQIHQISFEFKHLEHSSILIQILDRILKCSNKESCSLFQNLQIHILFEFIQNLEGPLLINSIRAIWKFLNKSNLSLFIGPAQNSPAQQTAVTHAPCSSPRTRPRRSSPVRRCATPLFSSPSSRPGHRTPPELHTPLLTSPRENLPIKDLTTPSRLLLDLLSTAGDWWTASLARSWPKNVATALRSFLIDFSLGLAPLSAPRCCRTIPPSPPAIARHPPSSNITVLRHQAASLSPELVSDSPITSPCPPGSFSLFGALAVITPHLIMSPAAGSRTDASALGTVTAQTVPGRFGHWARLRCETLGWIQPMHCSAFPFLFPIFLPD